MVSRTLPLRRRRSWSETALGVYAALFFVFLLAPLVVVIAVSFSNSRLMTFPPPGLSLRWYEAVLQSESFMRPAVNSLVVALAATVGSLVIGLLATYGLVRYRFPGRDLVGAFLLSPLVVPQLVTGIALLQYFVTLGLTGSMLALILGHIVITLPYVVRTISAVLVGVDVAMEEAAQNLGAGRLAVFRHIILPLIRPGMFAALIFAFLISFDNAVISLFLATARVGMLPIAIYTYIETGLDPAIAAVSTILIVNSTILVLIVYRLGRMDKVNL
ncbi:MAG: ABC transporter permease [Chloroflexi bacterium]|nr:ABC transporter permease [Chloroflexota bacterium]